MLTLMAQLHLFSARASRFNGVFTRQLRVLSVLVWTIFACGTPAFAQGTTTLALAASPNPSTFGQAVTLTATVSPATATGKVTFYDGVTVLGTSTLSGGQATLTTALLPSGSRSLRAYYGGDTSFGASASATVAQTVVPLPQNGFLTAVNYNVGINPWSVAVGDFNGDGKADLAVANQSSGNVSAGSGLAEKPEGLGGERAVAGLPGNRRAEPAAAIAGKRRGGKRRRQREGGAHRLLAARGAAIGAAIEKGSGARDQGSARVPGRPFVVHRAPRGTRSLTVAPRTPRFSLFLG